MVRMSYYLVCEQTLKIRSKSIQFFIVFYLQKSVSVEF